MVKKSTTTKRKTQTTKQATQKIANDPINPSHYKQGGMELIDVMKAFLSPDEYVGFLKGNVIKYTCRSNNKNGAEDLKKAQWYTNKLVNFVETGE